MGGGLSVLVHASVLFPVFILSSVEKMNRTTAANYRLAGGAMIRLASLEAKVSAHDLDRVSFWDHDSCA